VILVVIGFFIALAAMFTYNAFNPPPPRITQNDISNAVARVMASATPPPPISALVYAQILPSVVRIEAKTATGLSTGSGTVFDDQGNILSSLHIVEKATQIEVIFVDGSRSNATIVAAQPENDMVVLRAEILPDDLQPAVIAGSGGLHVGDEAFAIGAPFGISNSFSAGVISGLKRNFRSPKTGKTLSNLIQFDAAVNPGNSGGPLLNRNGEVVGIVTALLNPTDQDVFIGIGFAVPIETAAGAMGSPPY
jgi:S1-C subfamily serine protease